MPHSARFTPPSRLRLGLECTVLPNPVNWDRVRCEPDPQRRFVSFVNPQPIKGVFVFARIALELGRRRPEIPLLVVEGRGRAKDWLERTGLDLSGLTNLHRMANTPDPRHFYRLTRLLLMPSLWNESFGLVAAAAMLNGIPILASTRGALPETMGQGGRAVRRARASDAAHAHGANGRRSGPLDESDLSPLG